jgi:hypothetical protein
MSSSESTFHQVSLAAAAVANSKKGVWSTVCTLYYRAGATGSVGPVLAGPIFWQESGCAYFINQHLIEHARLK